jgi:hypothetical protein
MRGFAPHLFAWFLGPPGPQTPEIDDFRPAQNSCIKNPGVYRGMPKWFVGHVNCWTLGVPRPKKTTRFPETRGFVDLAAEGGKAKKPLVSGKRVVVWPW